MTLKIGFPNISQELKRHFESLVGVILSSAQIPHMCLQVLDAKLGEDIAGEEALSDVPPELDVAEKDGVDPGEVGDGVEHREVQLDVFQLQEYGQLFLRQGR